MISLTFFSMDHLALEKGLWQRVFFKLYTSLMLCTRSRVSRKSTEWIQVRAPLAAVSSSRPCTIWRWHLVRPITTIVSLSRNWSRRLRGVSSSTKLSRRLSRLSSSTSLISCRIQPRLVCVAQWRLTCPLAESSLTVKAFPKLLCPSNQDAYRFVCQHPKNKFWLSCSRRLPRGRTLSYHHKSLPQSLTAQDAISAALSWCSKPSNLRLPT